MSRPDLQWGEGGCIGDNMTLRGFYSFGDLYLDGIRCGAVQP